MGSPKRVIEATVSVIERQYLKMLFVVDDLQKEFENLSAGKTLGEKGERLARLWNEVAKGTAALNEAQKAYRVALKIC